MRRIVAAVAAVAVAACSTSTAPPTAPVPPLPVSSPAGEIPWDRVGPGWYLVLYDAASMEPAASGPSVLLAVDPDGILYLLHSWDGPDGPVEILDWHPTGQAALVMQPYQNNFRIELVDLVDRSAQPLCSLCWEAIDAAGSPEASFSNRADGDVIVYLNDGYAERLQIRNRLGEVTGTIFRQLFSDAYRSLAWLESPDGATLVVSHLDGLSVVGRNGETIRDLWTPEGRRCAPVRWWEEGVVLASCRGRTVDGASDFCNCLFLIPVDGSPGRALTGGSVDEATVGDFGYSAAWEVGEDVVVQWRGDCRAARVELLDPPGTPYAPGLEGEAEVVGVFEGTVAVRTWVGCNAAGGELAVIESDGSVIVLVPRSGSAIGVRSAVGID